MVGECVDRGACSYLIERYEITGASRRARTPQITPRGVRQELSHTNEGYGFGITAKSEALTLELVAGTTPGPAAPSPRPEGGYISLFRSYTTAASAPCCELSAVVLTLDSVPAFAITRVLA